MPEPLRSSRRVTIHRRTRQTTTIPPAPARRARAVPTSKLKLGKALDAAAIGPGPARLSAQGKVRKAGELQLVAGVSTKAKVKALQKEFWIDPRMPHLPGRASMRVSDGSWFYTDEPSIGLSPYGGNTGGSDLRIFFKPSLVNRPCLITFSLTVLAGKGRVTLSALGVQQTTTLPSGAQTLSMLVTPTSAETFTIMLGVDGASAAERVAVHGCDISFLS
jgi:hypothetical protein